MKPLLLTVMLLWLPGYGMAMPQDEVNASPIRVENAPEEQVIAARLAAITAAINGMEQIEISVNAGVVTLAGEVASAQLRSEAIAIASRLQGVVYVQDQLQEQLAVSSRLAPAVEKFSEMLATTIQMLPLLLVALLAISSFWLLGGWAAKRGAWLRRIGLSELASNLGMRFVRLLITGIGVLIALELLDATALVSAALGVAGVIGIALGFAFRNIVENYLAGVLLSTRNPFAIGDTIQIADLLGSVVRLTSRDTVLMTADGNHLRIPNSHIITSAMTNYSRNPLRRFEFNVGVSVDIDLVVVRQLAIATLQQMPGILTEPRPRVLVQELGDSTVSMHVLAWIDQRDSDFLKARSEAIRLVKAAFDHAGIEMPEPIYRIHMAQAPDVADPDAAPTAAAVDAAAVPPVDVSADASINQQLQDDLKHSDEENLLPASDASTKPAST